MRNKLSISPEHPNDTLLYCSGYKYPLPSSHFLFLFPNSRATHYTFIFSNKRNSVRGETKQKCCLCFRLSQHQFHNCLLLKKKITRNNHWSTIIIWTSLSIHISSNAKGGWPQLLCNTPHPMETKTTPFAEQASHPNMASTLTPLFYTH